jgi:hypothetical protein
MKKYLLPIAITLSAAAISLSAAFYSVSGLSKLFAGAGIAVTVMAAALEASKLVIASLLYRYRATLPRALKYYFGVAIGVLMIITSAGIYGLLSAGYQKTADKFTLSESKSQQLREKKQMYLDQKTQIDRDIAAAATSQTNVTGAIGSSVVTNTDARGRTTTRVNSNQQKLLERQLTSIESRREKLEADRSRVSDSITSIEQQIFDAKDNSKLTDELGPLLYLSKLTGASMDVVINWFLLLIIFVFDPLAIALVIAANIAFEKLSEVTEEPVIEEEILEEELIHEELSEIEEEPVPEPIVVQQEPDRIETEEVEIPQPEPARFDPEAAKWMDAKTRAAYFARFNKK